MTGQLHAQTAITREYPAAEGDPYYPILTPESAALFKRYEALAAKTRDVFFVGRLATFRYYNMDQVTGQALATFRRIEDLLPVPVAPAMVPAKGPARAADGKVRAAA
jgi:UDP-galactopyranose mutase